jgi:hypothetical protein
MTLGERPDDSPDWVSASETYNWCNKNALIDWFNAFGTKAGFVPDSHRPGYDKRFDYMPFVVSQSWAFRRAVVAWLTARSQIRVITTNPRQARDSVKAEQTIEAMNEGVAIIAHGVLWNRDDRVTCVPDLLVRLDVLPQLFSPHPALPRERGRERSYVVVDIHFVTLHVLKDGTASLEHLPYMVQNWIYNQALGKIQGYTPDASYLLGRDLFRAPARVNQDPELGRLAAEAAAWVRRLKKEGASWHALPMPSVPELRPNMKASVDSEWQAAKHEIALAQHDLTLLPFVGPEGRDLSAASGITRWDDPGLSARAVGLGDSAEGRRLDAVLLANRSAGDHAIFPARLVSNVRNWQQPSPVECFVNVQALYDQADDFSRVPERGGTAMFFMITWGWLDRGGQWQSQQLVARDLSASAEAEMIIAWQTELSGLANRHGVQLRDVRLFHWGTHEGLLPDLNWFSLLENLIHREPVTVRGAFGFGLAEMAQALHTLGLVETALPDQPRDPLAAMAGAWSAANEAASLQVPLEQADPIQVIAKFSHEACRSMMEILALLRQRAQTSLPEAA